MNKILLRNALVVLLCFGICLVTLWHAPKVHAQASYELDPPTTITLVGCQGGSPGACFLQTNPVPPQNCVFNTIYLSFDSTGIYQAMFSTAMMAQASGQAVRVVYTQTGGSGGQCNAALVSTVN